MNAGAHATDGTEGPLRALVLRLVGPMQAYGAASVAVHRPTEDAPTKSAVLGLLGAALGIDRADTAALVALDQSFSLVVRVDARGTALTDYHTAMDVPSMDGASVRKYATITRRTYLCDAAFTVLLVQSREETLAQWHRALRYPRYAPVLGRRACPPAVPLVERAPTVVQGADWRALLDAAPVAVAERRAAHDSYDVHVDESLCRGDDRALPARLVRRDRLVGPGPRMYWDRPVRVCAWRARGADEAQVAARESFDDHATEIDTTEGWS